MPPEGKRGWLTPATLAVLLGAADTYVVVLLLPSLMQGVGLDTSELQRAAPLITGFLLGYVAALPAAGKISDAVGRRAVLVSCLLLFAAGAVVTASAHGLGHAVAGRLLQGLGAGGVVPATLALVADLWPPDRRAVPLGVVGGVQEAGAVLGPLVGAGVLALAGWRWAFWGGAGLAMVLAASFAAGGGRRGRLKADWPGAVLGLAALAAAALAVVAPRPLVDDVTLGALWVPTGVRLTPITLIAAALALALVGRETTARHPLLPLRGTGSLLVEVDGVGLLLAATALAGVVLAFAAADPERGAVADSAPYSLTVSGLAAVAFVTRQRTARRPLIPRGTLRPRETVGSLIVSLLLGVALVAVLVDIPIYARTTLHDSSQLDAALVLLRFLAAVPIGAAAGGWLTRRAGPAIGAAAGLALVTFSLLGMAHWGLHALTRQELASNAALVAAGLGFGLAVAPVNTAALARAAHTTHGLVSSLVVVARTVGMLVGLSVLSAVGLRVYAERAAKLPSPLALCPDSPSDCPAFATLNRIAVVHELQVVFLLAAGCAAAAGALCVTLRTSRSR
ncbi:MAG: hypothetical protein QOE64_353 [Frankiales bacterium]|nr:hypothetical protein [Frankiales bacterium]